MTTHPYSRLGQIFRSARERLGHTVKEVETLAGTGSLGHWESGDRKPPLLVLRRLCEVLDVDFSNCLQILAETESNRWDRQSYRLFANDYASIPNNFKGFELQTLIMGDRRNHPPDTLADVLAEHVSVGDLFYYRDQLQIWHDKIIYMLPDETLRELFPKGILSLGSPAVNLGSRVINRAAAFRFFVPTNIDALEQELNTTFSRSPIECLKQRAGDCHRVVDGNRGHGFIDPFQPDICPGSVRTFEYGVLSLAPHPWDSEGMAILAGGRRGTATASVLQLLSADCFHHRPLGGLFKVHVPEVLGVTKRYPGLKAEWVTEPYSVNQYLKAIHNHKHCRDIQWADNIRRLVGLIGE